MPADNVEEGRAGVLQQVPPIGDLQRLRRAFGDCLAIAAAAIPAHDFDAGTLGKPGGDRASLPVRQEIDDLARLEITQDRPVTLALAPSEVVDADNLHAGRRWRRAPAQDAQQRVGADRHAQPIGKPFARAAAKR